MAFDDGRLLAGLDRDALGLHRLWHLTHQVDHEQAVVQPRILDEHEVGKLEATLEAAGRDTHVQEVRAGRLVVLLAGDEQQILLCRDLDLVARETGHREGDAVAIIGDTFEIEGRIVFGRRPGVRLDQVKKAIKADGLTAVGGQIQTHLQFLL